MFVDFFHILTVLVSQKQHFELKKKRDSLKICIKSLALNETNLNCRQFYAKRHKKQWTGEPLEYMKYNKAARVLPPSFASLKSPAPPSWCSGGALHLPQAQALFHFLRHS